MKKLKVFNLLNRYSDKKILARLFEKYPDQQNNTANYRLILESLRETEPKANDDLIKCEKFGCEIMKQSEENILEFGPMKYDEILGSDVNYANIDFICNLLWEITFYGFGDKENTDFFKEINMGIKELL